jgi:hypothetical protein
LVYTTTLKMVVLCSSKNKLFPNHIVLHFSTANATTMRTENSAARRVLQISFSLHQCTDLLHIDKTLYWEQNTLQLLQPMRVQNVLKGLINACVHLTLLNSHWNKTFLIQLLILGSTSSRKNRNEREREWVCACMHACPYTHACQAVKYLHMYVNQPARWPRGTLYKQKFALTSLTSGGCSISLVRSRTKAMEFKSQCICVVWKHVSWPVTHLPDMCISQAVTVCAWMCLYGHK